MKRATLILAGFLWTLLVGHGAEPAAAVPDATQTVSGGGVTVAVTYLNPTKNETPRFQVALNTHSVTLDSYDLKALALLRDQTGKIYAPTTVENKGGGHHRQVIVTFPKISPDAKRVEMVIKDIAGINERTFRWSFE